MNGSQMFISRAFIKAGPPIHLIWFVTAQCNLRCSHCFYHTELSSTKDEFSFDEITKTTDHLPPLLSISLTGGEPFLRKDLYEIVKLLCDKRLCKNISLFTNGFNTDQVITCIRKILSACVETNFFVGVSIDGFEAEQDKYRDMKGAYTNAVTTIKELQKIESKFKNLNVGVITTLHQGNQNIIKDLRQDIFSKFGIYSGITIIRGNPQLAKLTDINPDIYKETIEMVERDRKVNRGKKSLFYDFIDTRESLGNRLAYQTYTTGSRAYDCYAGSLMGIIYETGDVYPCEMLKDFKMGNLRDYDYDINKVWKSPEAEKIRKWIKRRKCSCTYECQYTCNTLYNIKFWPYFIKTALFTF